MDVSARDIKDYLEKIQDLASKFGESFDRVEEAKRVLNDTYNSLVKGISKCIEDIEEDKKLAADCLKHNADKISSIQSQISQKSSAMALEKDSSIKSSYQREIDSLNNDIQGIIQKNSGLNKIIGELQESRNKFESYLRALPDVPGAISQADKEARRAKSDLDRLIEDYSKKAETALSYFEQAADALAKAGGGSSERVSVSSSALSRGASALRSAKRSIESVSDSFAHCASSFYNAVSDDVSRSALSAAEASRSNIEDAIDDLDEIASALEEAARAVSHYDNLK